MFVKELGNTAGVPSVYTLPVCMLGKWKIIKDPRKVVVNRQSLISSLGGEEIKISNNDLSGHRSKVLAGWRSR